MPMPPSTKKFIKGHITLVGCPKLDSVDYSEKLTEIIRENDIKSVTIVRMEGSLLRRSGICGKKRHYSRVGNLFHGRL